MSRLNTENIIGIGDIHSAEKGSGARYNNGKPPMHLIPLRLYVDAVKRFAPQLSADYERALKILYLLADWQERRVTNAVQSALGIIDEWDECAFVFDYGRKKYAEWNWAKGMAWSAPFSCAVRHLKAILNGEEKDLESGSLHWGHVMCNLVMLATYESTFAEGDDRPAAGMLATMEAV